MHTQLKYEKPLVRDLSDLKEAQGACGPGTAPAGQCTPFGSAPGTCFTVGNLAAGCTNGPVAFVPCSSGGNPINP